MQKNKLLTKDQIKSIVSRQGFLRAAEDRLAQYLKVADKANVSFRCLDPGVPVNELDSGQVTMDGTKATIRIDGPLDWWWGIDVNQIVRDLDQAKPEAIDMKLNSPGGFLYDGLYLYHDLRQRAEAGVELTSLAQGVVASAAVLPFLAADQRAMPVGTTLFTHKPWTMALLVGNVDDMDEQFESIKESLGAGTVAMADLYALRLEKTKDEISELLSKDRWFTPAEAKEEGFTTAEPEDVDDGEGESAENKKENERYRNQAKEVMEAFQATELHARTRR